MKDTQMLREQEAKMGWNINFIKMHYKINLKIIEHLLDWGSRETHRYNLSALL